MASAHSPLHKEVSGLALFISVPQLIASPIAVGISHLIYAHNNVPFEVKEVLDFLVISFPLTLSVAIITVLIQKGQFNLFTLLIAVAGAAFLSNLLHKIVSEIPSIDMENSFTETFINPENRSSNNLLLLWILKIFGIYWKSFGPILFIQSCFIGIYAGDKYLKKEKNSNSAKK